MLSSGRRAGKKGDIFMHIFICDIRAISRDIKQPLLVLNKTKVFGHSSKRSDDAEATPESCRPHHPSKAPFK